MRVLHILNSLEGGATQSVVELMEAGLDQEESAEHFAVYPGRAGEHPDFRLAKLCAGVRPIPLATWNRKTDLAPMWRGVARARALQLTVCGLRTRAMLGRLISRWNIDVIHTNTAVIRQGAIIAKRLGMPHVWHVRERLGVGGYMSFWRSDPAAAKYFVEKSASVAVISRYVQDFFEQFGYGPNIRLVYDGIAMHRFRDPSSCDRGRRLRRQWGIPDDAPLAIAVGSPAVSAKRLDLFIRAAGIVVSRCPEARFVVVGYVPVRGHRARDRMWEGGVERFQEIRALSRAVSVDSAIVWADYESDMVAAMNAADILIHTCPVEAFSRSLLEAMAAGKPVVAPDAGGNTEGVRHGETGFLCRPDDPRPFAEAALRLIEDAGLREKLGMAGRRRAEECFSAETHYRTMMQVFKDAAQGSRAE